MAWWQCKTCKGVYEDRQESGEYFHHCPPIVRPGPTPPAAKVLDYLIDRPNKRDENWRARDDKRPKFAGIGRDMLPGPPELPPIPTMLDGIPMPSFFRRALKKLTKG